MLRGGCRLQLKPHYFKDWGRRVWAGNQKSGVHQGPGVLRHCGLRVERFFGAGAMRSHQFGCNQKPRNPKRQDSRNPKALENPRDVLNPGLERPRFGSTFAL